MNLRDSRAFLKTISIAGFANLVMIAVLESSFNFFHAILAIPPCIHERSSQPIVQDLL